ILEGAADFILKQNMDRLLPAITRILATSVQNANHNVSDYSTDPHAQSGAFQITKTALNSYQFTLLHPRFSTLFGVHGKDVLLASIGAIDDDQKGRIVSSLDASAKNNQPWTYEIQLTFAAGETHWLHASALPQLGGDGALRWSGVITDISEQKSREAQLHRYQHHLEDLVAVRSAELKANEQRLAAIVESMVDGILIIDTQGTISFMNEAVIRTFGYTQGELIGNNIKMLMPEPHASAHDNYLRDYIRTGHKKIIGIGREVLGRRKNGSLFPLDLAVSEWQLAGQTMFTGLIRDITVRKRLEEELSKQTIILDAVRNGLVQFMTDGNVFSAARQIITMLCELTSSQVGLVGEVTQHHHSPTTTAPENAITWDSFSRDFLNTLESDTFSHQSIHTALNQVLATKSHVIENHVIKDDYVENPAAFRNFLVVPVFYADTLVGMFSLINAKHSFDESLLNFFQPFSLAFGVMIHQRSITAIEATTRRALQEAKEDAERANRSKSEFLSRMSHELRTPLNAILGFAQLLSMDPSLGTVQRDSLTEIHSAGEHLLQLINEVLDLASIEAGRLRVVPQDISLHALCLDCVGLVKALAKTQNVAVHFDNHAPTIQVHADIMRAKQVLLNLLSNAIKYNHSGGDVHLEYTILDKYFARVTVTDNGIGIPAERQQELFQPFHRLGHETSQITGTGIGLAITKRLIELMGGRIDFSSMPNQETRFWIDIPRAQ
ncbi:MAG: PAS domain S-box protein, partial [Gammaproteobacteria bacterium]|nr:PAS domain S-box protein [Gammaproteobacteria bacterium]